MRRPLTLAAAALVSLPLAGAEAPSPEAAEVVRVVTEAYVDGIHNYRDVAAIRAGFHPDFEMLVLRDGELTKMPLAKWIESIEARNQKEAPPARDTPRTTEADFPQVSVTGDAAACIVELHRGGKQVFTDYLLLYRFPDGWKIVGKSFHRHA
jgi:hypothetical protein